MLERSKIEKIQAALAALKQGKLIVLQDDQDRENEGDLVGLATFAQPETINFALQAARGLLCAPMSLERAEELHLPAMVQDNTEKFGTKFTQSVDYKATVTGVSANDRAQTLQALANRSIPAQDFERPGHIFPLVAEKEGLRVRTGHTEAAVALAKWAGVVPVAYIIEILKADGSMARSEDLALFAQEHDLIRLQIADLVEFQTYLDQEDIEYGPSVQLPAAEGNFELHSFPSRGKGQPDLLIQSKKASTAAPLVRIHSECFTGDVLSSLRCDCGPQLNEALARINEEGGAVLYLRQEGRGIGLLEKLKAYILQENHYDTYDANLNLGHQADQRDYKRAAKLLKFAGLKRIRLLTNNPDKIQQLEAAGIEIVERVPLEIKSNSNNANYLHTKATRFGHLLKEN
ncbi:GTP cyclohydrolase II [Eupransor demetentiae]|uniref:GTP cyclohydrolase-2 n=1 Tax=Eupransor demetentiae TaxID=3109584 RepID=A0ABM9N486_9LACO|nr:GTP cyclohydrolase II (RibA) [Lactobacillaceae bacterium LMG 33000]